MKTTTEKKLMIGVLIPLMILVLGFILLVFMIYTEDEPGALPLGMIVVGTIWLIVKRLQSRSNSRQH